MNFKIKLGVVGLFVVVVLVLLVFNFDVLRHWAAIHIGSTKESGPYYGFWSGFGSDISEGAIAVGLYTGIRKVNCHSKMCWRIGHHPLEGTPYHLCKLHHPDVPRRGAKQEDILAEYQRYKDGKASSASTSNGAKAPAAKKTTATKKTTVAKKASVSS